MKLSELLKELNEVLEQYGDHEVSIMQEVDSGAHLGVIQVESQVKDVAVSCGKDSVSNIIIVGKELD